MSGFSERLSNLPPGVTDADIERQAGGHEKSDDLGLVRLDTIPESWKIVDSDERFVAQFANPSDALMFLGLARMKRWDNGEWEDWQFERIKNPTNHELLAACEAAKPRHAARCGTCLRGRACGEATLLSKQSATIRKSLAVRSSTPRRTKGR